MKSFMKRVFILVILVLIIVTSILGVSADSSDRLKTFIRLGAGKQVTGENTNGLNLTKQDLQFLGVYISNFFIPFGTELGVSAGDETSQNKEDIKKALQENLNFSETVSSTLTEELLGLSRSSIKELKIYVSKDYQKDLESVGGSVPLDYYTMLECMLGGFSDVIRNYVNDVNNIVSVKDGVDKADVIKDIYNGAYNYGYFGYEKDGKVVPVFDFKINKYDSNSTYSYTPSQIAFLMCLYNTSIGSGFGYNMLDFSSSEFNGSDAEFQKLVSNLNKEEALKHTSLGTKIKVDSFGNIIGMGANHQFILVPSCMNPYTWVGLDEEGGTTSTFGGTALNTISIPFMVSKNYKKIYDKRLADGKEKTLALGFSDFRGTIQKNPYLKIVRGSSNTTFDTKWIWGDGGSGGEFATLIRDAYKDGSRKDAYNIPAYNKNNSQAFSLRTDSSKVLDGYIGSDAYTNFVYVDNLGEFHFDNSENDVDFNRINISDYFSDSDTFTNLRNSVSSVSEFSNSYTKIEDGTMTVSSGLKKELLVGLYLTYGIASLSEETDKLIELGYKLNSDVLPEIPNESLVLQTLSSEDMENLQVSSIRDWAYYLLNPSTSKYSTQLLKTKINGFLLSWHDDMVGTNGSGSINGTTKYRGFSGYVTTPELGDIPWVASMFNFYYKGIPWLIVCMILVLLAAIIGGTLSVQVSALALVVFIISLVFPPIAINSAVGVSNRFSSSLYGEKFTYWALIQHEGYVDKIEESASGTSYSNYLKTLYSENADATGNNGGETIMLRWQAPKKMSSLMFSSDDLGSSSSNTSNIPLGILNKTYSGETYLDDKDSVYLYRSYIDIANFSRYIHRGLLEGKQDYNLNVSSYARRSWYDGLKESYDGYETTYSNDRKLGYANENKDGGISGTDSSILRVRLPLSSEIVSDAYAKAGTIKDLKLGDYVGINQNAFNFDIPMFNVGKSNKETSYSKLNEVAKGDFDYKVFDGGVYDDNDYSGLAAYGLMSENPFYYFSWYLYETGLSENRGAKGGYKDLLLSAENGGFFYNTKGNGELKDFVDMRSLFTYIIPYLKQGNDIVKEWDDTYGLFIYEGVPTDEGHEDDADIKASQELTQKYWHNLNVARLYNIYTPWVDIMYDCSYAKSEKISFLGKTYTITDPIDPSSYPEERPMIFSKSEMADYGLKSHQLTEVERRIIKAQEGMQERMFELLNYYSFSDSVLNTAAAMNCAFEFNETFSETSLFGTDHVIYPQTFELNDFSYDAFLRFILSNSTGESMIVDGDDSFYGTITSNSSMTTVIIMLILDFLGVYVVPAFKIFFIVGLFLLSILIIFSALVGVDSRMRFVSRLSSSLIRPVLAFLGVSVGMAWVVSLFMGSGSSGVVGGSVGSISLGDPVMVMLVMVVINGVVVYLYFRLLWGLYKDLRKYGKISTSFIRGAVGGAGAVMVSSVIGGGKSQSFFRRGKDSFSEDTPLYSNINESTTPKDNSGRESFRDRESVNIDFNKNRSKSKKSKSSSSKINSTIKSGSNKIKNPFKRKKGK